MKNIAFPLFLLIVSGCASGPSGLGGAPDVQVMQGSVLPAPDTNAQSLSSRPYLIGPFDRLVIDVFGIEELREREVQADAAGRISFPLAGVVDAAGLSPAELEQDLRQRLSQAYVRDPQVTVNLKETVSQVVTVDGEVREPGLYPVVGNMTLMRAVATAKGLTEYADGEEVIVFRTVGKQRYVALYDLASIRRGIYSDPEIYANDVVVVGESSTRRLFQSAVSGGAALSPIILLLQAATSGGSN